MRGAIGKALAVAAAGLLTFACGSETSTGDRPRIDIAVRGPAADGSVSIHAPASVEAGVVELSLTSSGSHLHDARLFRVDGERSATDIATQLEAADSQPWPSWLHAAGGVGATAPGERRSATLALNPGTYYIADTQEPPDESGAKVTGGARGAISRIDVTGEDAGDGGVPKTRARIVATEYGFETKGIRAGTRRVAFENAGREAHEAVVLELKPGASFAAARRAMDAIDYPTVEPSRRSPVRLRRFQTLPLTPAGGRVATELDLAAGRYLMLCYAADRSGGASHFDQGMSMQLIVTAASSTPPFTDRRRRPAPD